LTLCLKTGDSIFIAAYQLGDFEYLVSNQIKAGMAKVYYKKQHLFVDTVYHRLERFGGDADRFFYLPE